MLEIRGLTTEFATDEGRVAAVDEVSLTIPRGRTVGLVGESGCGKTVTALSILRLVPPPGRVVAGEVILHGDDGTNDLLRLSEQGMRKIRGNKISMTFQEPMTSLNPVFSVGEQIAEAVRLHQGLGRRAARERAVEMLRQVGIPAPAQRVDHYPHQLSGGMRQRVMVAMALACNPDLLIADEPTSALDVTVQAQILELIRRLQSERHMAVLLITHDLGVVAEVCEEVLVMYAGKVVERAGVEALFHSPRHPYTAGLLRSIPSLESLRAGGGPGEERSRPGEEPGDESGRESGRARKRRLTAIPGMVPDLRSIPVGCRFRDRCDRAVPECARAHPPLGAAGPGHEVACYNPREGQLSGQFVVPERPGEG